MRNATPRFFALLRSFSKDKKGASAIVFGITLPVLVGFMGLGTEIGYWYLEHRQLQTATDMSVMAAAFELRDEVDRNKAIHAAKREAIRNGFDAPNGEIVVNSPPSTGPYTSPLSVEVILTEYKPRLFSGVFQEGPTEITTRAVATSVPGGPACILALDQFVQGGITIIGTADVTLTGCNVHSNSGHMTAAAIVNGKATIVAGCFGASGGVDVTSGLILTDCAVPTSQGGVVQDPYSYLEVPEEPSTCSPYPGGGPMVAKEFSPGLYCNGLNLQGENHFLPGVYVLEVGGFRINAGAKVTGEDVTFILTNGGIISFNGTASINLEAPDSGPYAGVLIYQDREANPDDINHVNGDSTSSFEGVIYTPSQKIVFNGNGTTSSPQCTHVIGRIVHLSGTASFGNDCTDNGTNEFRTPGAIVLVE
jgi:hypothetical protein